MQKFREHDAGKVREGVLEKVTSELNLEGKRNHHTKAHLCNYMASV